MNIGGPDPKSKGRDAVIDFLKTDVANIDKKYDSRELISLTSPHIEGNRLSRQWRCTYTLAGSPDLVVEGEARYLFDRELIKEIEEELTTDSIQKLNEWMAQYGEQLHA